MKRRIINIVSITIFVMLVFMIGSIINIAVRDFENYVKSGDAVKDGTKVFMEIKEDVQEAKEEYENDK